MNTILIGMRGTGKSTVGEALAGTFGMPFVDSDALIAKEVHMSIPEFVATKGWPAFRSIEAEIINQIAKRDDHVISTGGGIVLDQNNIAALQPNGNIILLTASLDILVKRIAGDTNRPNLTTLRSTRAELEATWNTRKHLYHRYADEIIDTSETSVDQAVHMLLRI